MLLNSGSVPTFALLSSGTFELPHGAVFGRNTLAEQ